LLKIKYEQLIMLIIIKRDVHKHYNYNYNYRNTIKIINLTVGCGCGCIVLYYNILFNNILYHH
jgi:hypothetical protein